MNAHFSFRTFVNVLTACAVILAALGFVSPAAAQSACGATYVVQRGDYLTKIARTCGVSYADLLKANPGITNPSLIYAGQVINIPAAGVPVTGSESGMYTVQQGDTLANIAQRFGLTVAEINRANPNLGSTLQVGQVLNIPGRIRFASGGTAATLKGQVGSSARHTYLMNVSAGQLLDITVTGPSGLSLAVIGVDGSTLKGASSTLAFRGVVQKTQDYIIEIGYSGNTTDFTLTAAVPARISFAAGGTSASLSGSVPANGSQYYILGASKGQTLNVSAAPKTALQLSVYGVDGTVLKTGAGEEATFSGVLPGTQDYILVLKAGSQAQSYSLSVSIPALTPAPSTGSYTVQKGDTLLSIARRFQTTVAVLQRANPEITNSNVISVGQVIYLPGATIKLSNGKLVYIAKSGDSMSAIARQFNVTLSALNNANTQISNPNLIYTGQRINIP